MSFDRLAGQAAQRFKELFDLEALTKTLCNELNSFSETTAKDSLAGQFMKWADEKMPQKHLIFDEETCSKVVVEGPLAFALLEAISRFLAEKGLRCSSAGAWAATRTTAECHSRSGKGLFESSA